MVYHIDDSYNDEFTVSMEEPGDDAACIFFDGLFTDAVRGGSLDSGLQVWRLETFRMCWNGKKEVYIFDFCK